MDSLVAAGRHTIEGVVGAFGGSHPAERSSPSKPPVNKLEIGSQLSEPKPHVSVVGQQDHLSPTESKASMAFSDNMGYETATEGHASSRYSEDIQDSSQTTPKNMGKRRIDGVNEKSSSATIVRTPSSPKVPPRPRVSRPGGLLSRRRADSSRALNKEDEGGRSIEKKIQTMSAPNMRVVLEPETESDNTKQDRMEAIPSEWVDLAPEASEASESHSRPKTTVRQRGPRSPLSIDSEASNDTVVDWFHNTTRPPVPTMTVSPPPVEEVPPTLKRSAARKPKKSSPASLDHDYIARSDDTVVQWSKMKKSPRLFDIHKDIGPVLTAGPSTSVEQTPPPPILLPQATPPSERAPPASSPLKETIVQAAQPSPSPSKTTQLRDPPVPSQRHALPPRKLHQAASIPNARPFRPLPASASPSHPPVSSPQTFTPPGPPPLHAPPLPPRTQPAAITTPEDLRFVELSDQLQKALHKDLKVFRRDVMEEFAKQKAWVEGLVRERDGYMRRVEEENRRLREELARARGGRRR